MAPRSPTAEPHIRIERSLVAVNAIDRGAFTASGANYTNYFATEHQLDEGHNAIGFRRNYVQQARLVNIFMGYERTSSFHTEMRLHDT